MNTLASFLFLLATACATPTPNPDPLPAPSARLSASVPLAISELVAGPEQAWVVVPDGTLSCGKHFEPELGDAASKLEAAGVRVAESRHAHDGRMHAMACGMPTGGLKAYLIARKDLARALKSGFVDSAGFGKNPVRRN